MMSKWMAEIDQRTRLAGANKIELLMFSLGSDEIYGINVFKIREVMKLPPVTKIPDSDARVLGVVNLRGENIPVVDLRLAIGIPCGDNPEESYVVVVAVGERHLGIVVG
jgi:two-component system chemotaxis response regulator CheV